MGRVALSSCCPVTIGTKWEANFHGGTKVCPSRTSESLSMWRTKTTRGTHIVTGHRVANIFSDRRPIRPKFRKSPDNVTCHCAPIGRGFQAFFEAQSPVDGARGWRRGRPRPNYSVNERLPMRLPGQIHPQILDAKRQEDGPPFSSPESTRLGLSRLLRPSSVVSWVDPFTLTPPLRRMV